MALAPPAWSLRLYFNGRSDQSARVIEAVEALLGPDDELEMIDVTVHPERAEADRVLATPTLLKLAPTPRQRVIGEFVDAPALRRVLGRGGEAGRGP